MQSPCRSTIVKERLIVARLFSLERAIVNEHDLRKMKANIDQYGLESVK
jgi:hypothetical protein